MMDSESLKPIIQIYTRILKPFVPREVKRYLRSAYSFLVGRSDEKKVIWETCAFYRKMGIIKTGDLVFDIGANRGMFTAAFLTLGAEVVCAEPDPRCLEILRKKFGADPRVHIEDAGIGDHEGQMKLEIGDMDGNATFSQEFKELETASYSGDYVSSTMARMTTLDALIKKYGLPKYCKIDVEGFELQVLSGLSRQIPLVSFEFHREMLGDARKCAEKLRSLGKASFNFTHYDPVKPIFEAEWTSEDKLFAAIESEEREKTVANTGDINTWRVGDIFARAL